MTCHHPVPRCAKFALLIAFLGVSCGGCSALQVPELRFPALPFSTPKSPRYTGAEPGFDVDPAVGEQVYHAVREAKNRNAIVLQVVGDSSPVRVLPLPEDGRSVSVSHLLSQTGVGKKLGSLQATLFRPSPGSIAGLPMEVKMADDGRSVRPESDYALRAGDRIRVKKAVSPAVNGLLEEILGI